MYKSRLNIRCSGSNLPVGCPVDGASPAKSLAFSLGSFALSLWLGIGLLQLGHAVELQLGQKSFMSVGVFQVGQIVRVGVRSPLRPPRFGLGGGVGKLFLSFDFSGVEVVSSPKPKSNKDLRGINTFLLDA